MRLMKSSDMSAGMGVVENTVNVTGDAYAEDETELHDEERRDPRVSIWRPLVDHEKGILGYFMLQATSTVITKDSHNGGDKAVRRHFTFRATPDKVLAQATNEELLAELQKRLKIVSEVNTYV